MDPADTEEQQSDHHSVQARRWPALTIGFVTLALLLALQAAFTPAHLTLQLALFDAYQALWPRERQSAPAGYYSGGRPVHCTYL